MIFAVENMGDKIYVVFLLHKKVDPKNHGLPYM